MRASGSPRKRGPKPRPRDEHPTAAEGPWEDPLEFHTALRLHIRRHGETIYRLLRALRATGRLVDYTTLRLWCAGEQAPQRARSLVILAAIEDRYRLPRGYFRAKLPHGAAAVTHLQMKGVPPAERRRIAWHLPDDFDARSATEREEILSWVRRVVVSGATAYRQYQRAALKHRFALDLRETDADTTALRRLRSEAAELVTFKTATLTALGYRRHGVWGEETVAQRLEHLGLMFGAMVAAPGGPVRGLGVPPQSLTLAMLVLPQVWDWYLRWREARRGFFTRWEADMLISTALALTAPAAGWLAQTPALAQSLTPIPELVTEADIATVQADWAAACARLHAHAQERAREIKRLARVHHDPFEPILVVLEARSPVGEYRKIADEILQRMPSRRRYPQAAAEAVRAFLMLRLGLHLGFRQRNLRQLLVCPRQQAPRPEGRLVDLRRGELRWSERDNGWEVLAPARAFKNFGSSFFGGRPFRLLLPDLGRLYEHIDLWLACDRARLLRGGADPGTFFVKSARSAASQAEFSAGTFYEAWRWIIQRYGIFNPWTGRGAIPGLLPHGPHNVRDVLATHILKQTGSFEQASYAIQDTPEMVAHHYGRFLPQDKAAMAAEILNKVWDQA